MPCSSPLPVSLAPENCIFSGLYRHLHTQHTHIHIIKNKNKIKSFTKKEERKRKKAFAVVNIVLVSRDGLLTMPSSGMFVGKLYSVPLCNLHRHNVPVEVLLCVPLHRWGNRATPHGVICQSSWNYWMAGLDSVSLVWSNDCSICLLTHWVF